MIYRFFVFLLFVPLFFLSVCVFANLSKASEQAYFKALPDIPLMPSMIEMEDQSFIFDKAEGRVVELVGFLSASSPQKIYSFYEDVFKNLGWKPLNKKAFIRNEEKILLKIEEVPEGLKIYLRLSPQPLPLSR